MMHTLSDINWNQVYYFYEVAKRLSMTEASRAIGVSTPTISEHIKKLESQLDVLLFKRKTRQIELTMEGKNLFNHAEKMFNTGFRFLDAVSPKSIGGYPARIGIIDTISINTPIQFVFNYLSKYSEFGTVNTIRERHHDQLEHKILANELDWGISLYKPKLTALESSFIGHSEIVFCASQKVFKKFKDKQTLLSSMPLVKSSRDQKLNQLVRDHLSLHGIYMEESFESDHRQFCISLIQKGLCISTFDKDEIEQSSWGKNLKAFTIGSPIYLSFYAIWPKGGKKMISIKKLIESLPKKQSLQPR